MSDTFTPITTQEELNRVIGERLKREQAKYADYEELKEAAEKYKDYDQIKSELETTKGTLSTLQSQYGALDEKSKEKDSKIAAYETEILKTNVAVDEKLPLEMRKYLQGNNEEELRQSAGELLKFYNTQNGGDPDAHLTPDPAASENAIYMEMAKALKE